MTAMIELQGLTKEVSTGGRRVSILRGVNLQVPRGQFVAVMGPSGSGKSTLLGLVAGLDRASAGSVRLDGQDITHMSEDQLADLRGRKLGFVFQSFHLIPTLTALENVALPLELLGAADAGSRSQELLAAVGLADRMSHYPAQLSGGEQQRVAVARAFAARPALLLADEPTGNLDSETGLHIMGLLIRLNQQEGTTLVLVTHDPALAARADRVVRMRDGQILGEGVGT